MDNRLTGTVIFFNMEEGFGFIRHDADVAKETFVVASELIDEIKAGDKVEFELEKDDKGWVAVNVKRIG